MTSLYTVTEKLPPEVEREFYRLGEVLTGLGLMAPELLAAPPEFPQPRQIVAADRVNWDPLAKGSGPFYFVYWDQDEMVWKEIGSGAEVDLGDFYTKEQIDALLAALGIEIDGIDTEIGEISETIDILTDGLDDVVTDLVELQGDVDTAEEIIAQNSLDIADLVDTYGNTASSAASAAAAAASEAAAIAAQAAAILAKGGAETARDEAVTAQVAAESASDDASNSASASATSASSAAAFADDAETAAAASESSRVEAVAAANAAVNAAQGGVTVDAAPGALWQFTTDLDGWTGSDPTPTWDSDGFMHQEDGSDPHLESPSVSVSGAGYKEVVARIRRNAGTGWEGRLRWSTSGGHGFSGSFEKVIANPILVDGDYQIVTWDLSAESDWTSSIITAIELQVGSNGGSADYDFDWIAIGNNLASLAQAAVQAASDAAASASDAASSAAASDSSAVSASASAAGAAGSASAAATSATSAAASATAAGMSASAADTSKVAAQTAQAGAESAETSAVSAKEDAESAAASASSSETNAAVSATQALGSASAASSSASLAETFADNAEISANAAEASQVSAGTSSTNAANSASAAATSASSAAASSTAAGGSASSASGSATQAATSESNAATSAFQAANSSNSAANSAASAGTSASLAGNAAATATTQASNATASATQASLSATAAANFAGSVTLTNPLNVAGNVTSWTTTPNTGNVGPLTATLQNLAGRNMVTGAYTADNNGIAYTDEFDIDPAGIYEVRFSVRKGTAGGEIYVGAYTGSLFAGNFQGIVAQANSGSPTGNIYWVAKAAGTVWEDYTVYLCGSAVNPADVPDALAVNGSLALHAIKNVDTRNRQGLRFLNWANAGTTRTMNIANVFVTRYDNKSSAAFKQEVTTRASQHAAQATQITTLQTSVAGNTSSITTLQTTVNGISATYTIQLDVNGHVTGLTLVNGGPGASSVVFRTDRFAIALPGFGQVFPFVVGSINGVATVGITGNLIVDGTIFTRNIQNGGVTTEKLPPNSISRGVVVTGITPAFAPSQNIIVCTANYTVGDVNGRFRVDWALSIFHSNNSDPAGKISGFLQVRRNGGVIVTRNFILNSRNFTGEVYPAFTRSEFFGPGFNPGDLIEAFISVSTGPTAVNNAFSVTYNFISIEETMR